MINRENIQTISDEELLECVPMILQKLAAKIKSQKQYIHKVQSNNSDKETYLLKLSQDLNLFQASHGFFTELLLRFQKNNIAIPETVWEQATEDARARGSAGKFGLHILIENFTITQINILPNEQ